MNLECDRSIGNAPVDDAGMLSTQRTMPELFPFNSLSAKQTVIVSELLRVHPRGYVESQNGRPVFVSGTEGHAVRVVLTEQGRAEEHDSQAGGQSHPN